MNTLFSQDKKLFRRPAGKRLDFGRFVIAVVVLTSSQSLLEAQQPKSKTEIQAEKVLQSRSDTKNILNGRILKMEDSAADILVDDQSTPYVYDNFTIFEIDGKPGKVSDIPVGADVKFFPDTSKDGRISRMYFDTTAAGRVLGNEVEGDLDVAVPTAESRNMQRNGSEESNSEDSENGIPSLSEAADDVKVENDPVEPVDIGIELKTTTDGVLVLNVDKEKSGHQSGLKPGDIILKVGDTNLATDKGVNREISKYSASTRVPLEIERGGEKQEISLELPQDHQPEMKVTAKKPAQSPSAGKGINKKKLGWRLTEVDEKIVIAEVEPVSIVGASDAEEGDQILQINGLVVTSIADVQAAMDRSDFDQTAKLTLQRGQETLFVTLGDQSESDTPGQKTGQSGTPSIQPRKNNSSQNGQADVWDMINRQQAQIFQLQQEIQRLKSGQATQQQ